MLCDEHAIELRELLYAPEGYRLEHIFLSTYSLEGEALYGLAAYGCTANASPDDTLERVCLSDLAFEKERIRDFAEKHITVLSHYEHHSVSKKTGISDLVNDLAGTCVHTIKRSGSFHAKLLLPCFKKIDGEDRYYRLCVGSKNFSANDAGLEFSLCFESCERADEAAQTNEAERADEAKQTGAELYAFIASLLKADDEAPWLRPIGDKAFRVWKMDKNKEIIADQISFASNRDSAKKIFYAIKNDLDRYPAQDNKIYAYSPFLTPEKDGKMYLDSKLNELNVTVQYYTNLTAILHKYRNTELAKRIFCADGKCDRDGRWMADRFVHAKLYCWETAAEPGERCFRIWLGSANASEKGFEKNSEFMAGLCWRLRGNAASVYAEEGMDPAAWSVFGRQSDKLVKYRKLQDMELPEILIDDSARERIEKRIMEMVRRTEIKCGRTDGGYELRCEDVFDGVEIRSIEDRTPQNGTVTVEKIPCGSFARVLFCAKAGTKIDPLSEDICVLMNIRVEPVEGGEVKKAEPIYTLLKEIRARDVILRCRRAGFSAPDDGMFERVEAFLASWSISPETEKKKKEELLSRIDRVSSEMEKAGNEYMTETEKEKLIRLKENLKNDTDRLSEQNGRTSV